MKLEFGKTLIEKRFGKPKKISNSVEKKLKKEKKLELSKHIKEFINKDSITEFNGADKLNELLEIKFNSEKLSYDHKDTNNKDGFKDTYDLKKSIPPRVPYTGMTKEEYKTLEMSIFNLWKKINYNLIFERNIEIWRQFWITCERSDVIIQIIDARNPDFFINRDIIEMYPDKKHVIFANKSDLIFNYEENDNLEKFTVVNYSSKTNIKPVIDFLNDTSYASYGFIGYPNVGKSSTINAIINKKKVKVSQTPGKTKYIQSIEYSENKILLDCPGLVFPKHSKTSLLLNGILNVDKVIDLRSSLYEVIRYIGIDVLCLYYKIENTFNNEVEFINGLSIAKSVNVIGCIKNIVKDLFNGNIQYLRKAK